MPKEFESAFKELDIIVEKMEKGGLSLNESLKQFEKGIQLIRDCQILLKHAEQKIQIYSENSNALRDFNSFGESD
jgi:exodeoxyribonuclease VII small subunit